MTQSNDQFHNDHSYNVKLGNITASFTAGNYQRNLVTFLGRQSGNIYHNCINLFLYPYSLIQ